MIRRLAAAVAAAAAVAVITTPAALGQVPQNKPTGIPLSMTPEQRDPQTGVVSQQGAMVSGQFTMNPQGVVEEIDLRVDSLANPPAPVPDPNPAAVCSNNAPPCGQQTVQFSHPLPALAYNGPYGVTAWAYGSDQVFTSHAKSDDVTLPGGFKLAVAPAVPANVTATYDKSSGYNVVRWDRNPEPDIRLYVIQHKRPSDHDFTNLGTIPQSKPGSKVAIAEPVSPGEYQYRVDAKRAGADPTDPKQDVDSGFSNPPAKVTVPAPPPGSTAPHGSPPAPTAKPVTKSQLPKPRSSSSGSSSSRATTLTTESVSPDEGFARGSADVTSTIPGDDEQSGRDDRAVALLPKSKHGSSNRLAIFGPVAGGAVLFMFAFHLRYLKGRLDEAPPLT